MDSELHATLSCAHSGALHCSAHDASNRKDVGVQTMSSAWAEGVRDIGFDALSVLNAQSAGMASCVHPQTNRCSRHRDRQSSSAFEQQHDQSQGCRARVEETERRCLCGYYEYRVSLFDVCTGSTFTANSGAQLLSEMYQQKYFPKALVIWVGPSAYRL